MKRPLALFAAGCMVIAGLSTGIAPAGADASPRPTPVGTIRWGPCSDPGLVTAHAQCGFLAVPLDYGRPTGDKIQLAVSRVRHTSPDAQYQGVMLVNPGGPGGSGLGLATLGQSVPGRAGDTYDWIGFDPRGVGSSKPALSCVPDYFKGPRPPYVPTSPAILDSWLARSKSYADACAQHAPALLRHMRTADVARDMDQIRAALAASTINYYGLSYGTYLGQVYATLFPSRVRRMVLDSNVDPRSVWYRAGLHEDLTIERNMRIWFGWVAKYDNVYHLGKTAAAVGDVFYNQQAGLVGHPAGGVVGPAEWNDGFSLAAYGQSLWTLLAGSFSNWVWKHDSGLLIAVYQGLDTPGDDNAFAVYTAVVCTDAPWPKKWATWARDSGRTYRIAPFFTWNSTWYNAPCLTWAAQAGRPVEVSGHKVHALLVDETLDGVTPYPGSLEVRRRFPNSSLIAVVGGTTHAGTLLGNACVDNQVAYYLASGIKTPRKPGDGADATCAPLPQPVPAGA